ncbi:penicillin-binding protein activator [Fertoebacter nigrum]|uniref:Penicillin-binding protein activator n=1 Tax=Fertoeibacter niger TaxID=2656921 RepID=A0A8X8GYF5_9RHOB|nr:penicillin-binding protein activator [Fertoeibacter niger]NUB42767.1 penicillin-binding protein activator [Fertoeibacter niger]
MTPAETAASAAGAHPRCETHLTRRGLVRSALASWAVPFLAAPLAACGALPSGGGGGASRAGGRDAALLLPLTGAAAALGQNMGRAASLVTQGVPPEDAPKIHDTADSAEGAAAAARAAIAAGARILLGPLRSDQTPAVLAVAGNVPVITFSNDDALGPQGAFVMGITPAQSVSTMFSYARAQGVQRIALVARDTPLGQASAQAAQRIAAAGGITLTTALLRDPGAGGLVDAIRQASGGTLPQAVFLPDGGATLTAFARALRGSSMQILGSVQWGVDDVTGDGNLAGAWFAAPPPDLFLPFADRFQVAFGEQPGIVAALGHDAALLAVGLGANRALNRRGVARAAGFTGVLGAFRFLDDGRCQRDLSVLAIEGGQITLLGEVAGT